ncbi:MAG: glycogen debranching enzyme, partial [Cyclobacteriaceae bacterium]|nr:glycogen debranching enzyme [Cyclobacteriaceae bacterium]
NQDLFRFVRELIRMRLMRESAQQQRYPMNLREMLEQRLIAWHGVRLNEPDWSDHSHSLAFTVTSISGNTRMHYMINAWTEPLEFELEITAKSPWKRWIDTSLPSPKDIVSWEEAPKVSGSTYKLKPFSVVVLVAIR